MVTRIIMKHRQVSITRYADLANECSRGGWVHKLFRYIFSLFRCYASGLIRVTEGFQKRVKRGVGAYSGAVAGLDNLSLSTAKEGAH